MSQLLRCRSDIQGIRLRSHPVVGSFSVGTKLPFQESFADPVVSAVYLFGHLPMPNTFRQTLLQAMMTYEKGLHRVFAPRVGSVRQAAPCSAAITTSCYMHAIDLAREGSVGNIHLRRARG